QAGPLRQSVALKLFTPGTCTREAWEARVQRGAELWAVLTHPHLVPFQRAGWWDGVPYLAVEYVPQGSLADRLAGHPLPGREPPRLAGRLPEVATYRHGRGAAPATPNPSNAFRAADGIPRLVDFPPTGGLSQAPLPAGDADPAGLGYLTPE